MCLTLNSGAMSAKTEPRYVLEKVVELSRHGVRPPTPKEADYLAAGTNRSWSEWVTPLGELTGHGYAASMLKARYEGEYYRKNGLLKSGCGLSKDVYIWSSPVERSKATALAYVDGMFPACNIPIHYTDMNSDYLFHFQKLVPPTIPLEKAKAEIEQILGGSLSSARQRMQPEIARLKSAVCLPGKACPMFDTPWQIKDKDKGGVSISGLESLGSMGEVLLLQYSENKPLSEVAFGKAPNAAAVGALLPLLTLRYDVGDDRFSVAQQGGSVLLNQIRMALELGTGSSSTTARQTVAGPPDVAYLLYVAHDTNVAFIRRLMSFTWQLGDYPRGNIPPTSSLVFERWQDRVTKKRFIRLYFQTQSLDQTRSLTPINQQNKLLTAEYKKPDCQKTRVGTLCPIDGVIEQMNHVIDYSTVATAANPLK
ncbi:4-phytase/acid phosphatase [Zymomonas mobilis]|uniref:4-phytase/acid phosphatase n=1 Tax=Zymomonas mobilis TaxID=542 RepID=A0A542VZ56_ZYMMB|nr:histidine-type phosphatase [Zymomonas mobilis]TQL16611.1 4-phytase/acid phosphatase [Zymomonas mobilis]